MNDLIFNNKHDTPLFHRMQIEKESFYPPTVSPRMMDPQCAVKGRVLT